MSENKPDQNIFCPYCGHENGPHRITCKQCRKTLPGRGTKEEIPDWESMDDSERLLELVRLSSRQLDAMQRIAGDVRIIMLVVIVAAILTIIAGLFA